MTKPVSSALKPTRPRVLLVEDDELVRKSLARLLRREFDVVAAPSAEDAMAKIADDLYAVVTDHDLGPGHPDGRHVLAEVRRRVPTAKRILISGEPRTLHAGEGDLWHAMFLKPVSRDELLAALGARPSK